MEEARVLVSTSWQQRLGNENYKNWLKVGYGIDLLCKGIRPYIERETKAFHASLTARLHGIPPCTCTHTPRRRPNPYHDMITCEWAKELKNHHKGKPTWKQSVGSLWNDPNVGYWEIAKLYMPSSCATGKVCAAETDATGLLNLLSLCTHYKTDATLVGNFKETRNTWAHERKQELDMTELADAFMTMKNALKDPELTSDIDATNALKKITVLEKETLIDFEDIEVKVVNHLKDFMISIKDEIIEKVDQNAILTTEIKDILHYCMKDDAERDEVLRDIQNKIQIIELREEEKAKRNRRMQDICNNSFGNILLLVLLIVTALLGMCRLIPSRARVLLIFLVLCVTVLDENMVDFGCTRNKFDDPLELKQFDFTEYLNNARQGFVGRQWLFKNITESLDRRREESKGVMIIGAPGFGKSALISNLICSKLSSFSIHSQILGYHLCVQSDKNTLNGAKFVRNLANMIAWRLQEYKYLIFKDKFIQRILKVECLSDPAGCFEQGILTPLSQLQLRFQSPMYIVVDALDECLNEKDSHTDGSIVDILSHKVKRFPSWLKVIATSRNVTSIRRKLSGLLDVIELHPEDPENLRDIERFLFSKIHKSVLSRVKSYFLSIEYLSVSNLVRKSQGNFLYIKLILEYLGTNDFNTDKHSLPDSINSVYRDFFERKYDSIETFRAPRKIFEILVATKSPVTVIELYGILSTENKDFDFDYDLLPILEELSMYLCHTQGHQTISIFHNSLTEWLTSNSNKGGIFYVDEKKGNRALADYFLKRIRETSINVNPKFVYDLATYVVIGGNLKRHTDSFLQLDPKFIEVKDNRTEFTALHLAAGAENEGITGILLKKFKDVNIEDNKGRTPAFFAVKFGYFDNLRLLHEKGASLSHVTKPQPSFVQTDVFDKTFDCKRQMCGYTLLHVAAQNGHCQIVQYLIKNGVNLSSLSGTSSSAVHLAAEYGHIEIMKMLLSYGADADNTCLYYAALFGQVEIVKFLLKKGVEDSCIYCPASSLKASFIQASGNLRHCNTALHAAAIGDFPEVIEALLNTSKHNAINCVNYFGKEPLHEAVHHNNYQATNELLKFGVDTLSTCKFSATDAVFDHKFCFCGYTPLHIASHYGFAAITDLLLRYKADYNATDCEGLQPIHVAACRGHGDVLPILVKNGADVNSRGPNELTPIHYACKCKAHELFDQLFELGADGLALTADGKTPLHFIIQDYFIDEKFYFVDPYVSYPIDPVCFESESKVVKTHTKTEHFWLTSCSKFLQSFTKSKSALSDLDAVLGPFKSFLSYGSVLPGNIINKLSSILVGTDEHTNIRLVVLSTPAPFPVDIGLASCLQNHHKHLPQIMKINVLPTFLKTKVTSALTVATGNVKFVCSRLISFVDHNFVYAVDAFLHLGMDVNCEEKGVSPILVYLRLGGRNMAKVLVKHGVTTDIQCGEYFKDSIFHLSAYHKLHYLQYLSVFRDPIKWEEYLKDESALFDYLFDAYEEISTKGQLKLTMVDGPVTTAIKSNFRGFRIIDECLDNEGYTALHRAAQGGNVVAVKHFLKWGANASLESPEEFDILTLTIWYAVKYRPYFNLHKPSLLTSLEIEFASLTAGVILKHLTKSKPFDIGCDHNKKTPTLLHLAATRGMWRFIDDLFIAKDHWDVIGHGLTANCPTEDNITPMYLAKLHAGDDCDWDNPWCKVVGILSQYGGSMIYPDRVTEYFLLLNFLFHELPERFDINELNQEEIQMLPGDCKECGDFEDTRNIISGTHLSTDLMDDYQKLSSSYPLELRDVYFYTTITQYLNIIVSLLQYENNFQTTKLDYYLFLSTHSINMKWSLHFYRNIDDSILRCVPLTVDPVSKYPSIANPNNDEHLEPQEKVKDENTRDPSDIDDNIISSNWFDPIPDMCSSKSTIDFERLDKVLLKNRNIFNSHHKAFVKEIEKAKQTIRQQKVKLGVFDSVDKLFHNVESRMRCQMKGMTYKYARLKFLLHTLKFWSAQVKTIGMYPVIPNFASERIQDIFQSEDQKEMINLIIKLAKIDPSDRYEYTKMLRFSSPPLKETFRKSDDTQ